MSPHRLDLTNRSGVAQIETMEESRDDLVSVPDAIKQMRQALNGMTEDLSKLARIEPLFEQLMLRAAAMRVRANSHRIFEFNTNAAPTTNDQGQKLDVRTIFGGEPGMTVSILSVGGGNLEVNINGEGWQSVLKGDFFDNETITEISVRVTTGAAGTARIRLGAYVGSR